MIASLANQLGQLIGSQSVARRATMLLIIMGSICGLIFIMARARTGGYIDLYSGLESADTREAMSILYQLDIPARVADGNRTIQVPRNKASQATIALAEEGIPGSGAMGWEGMDKTKFGQSKMQQEKRFQRMQEGELSRTLMTIKGIQRARVHLALPDKDPFIGEEQPPTAAVSLGLRTGTILSPKQISGIIHLVSHAVEGLEPKNVSIVGAQGNLLNPPQTAQSKYSSAVQQTFKLEQEEVIKFRIESMLAKEIGEGRVVAWVQANYDFSTLHQVKEIYNPDDQEPIIQTENKVMEGLRPSQTVVEGLEESGPASAGGGSQGRMRSETTTQLLVTKMWEDIERTVPLTTQISVAVLVGGKYEETTDAEGNKIGELIPPTTEELGRYEELVKAIIGFTSEEERQDTVTVKYAPFKLAPIAMEFEEPKISYEMRRMIEWGIEWGIVGVIGLALILMVLRPAVKQILVTPMAPEMAALPAGSAAALPSTPETTPPGYDDTPSGGGFGLTQELELPEDVAADSERARALKKQHMAVKRAKLSSAQAHEIHQEVLGTARSDPAKTVSLLRQWMDEA